MILGELPADGLADIEGAGTTDLFDLHREGVPGSTLVAMARSIALMKLQDDLYERLRASLRADAVFALEEIDDFKREGRP